MPSTLILLTAAWLSWVPAQEWDAADRDMRRLPPSAFTELPAAVQQELTRRGCTVPQPFTAAGPENVIHGRFTSSTRQDWAVLCSIRRTSSILVFRGGSPSSVLALATEPDKNRLQVVGDGVIGYSRRLSVADRAFIQLHYERYGGPKPPSIDHDGIDDAFIEKASGVWYWYLGRWLQLSGAD